MARTYTLTAGQVIGVSRRLMQDARTDVDYRVTDADMLVAVNEAMSVLVGLRPGLFAQDVAHACTAGSTQTLQADRAAAIIDIPGLWEFDAAALSSFLPSWRTEPAGVAVEWARYPGDPLRFELYPPSAADQALTPRVAIAPVDASSTSSVLQIPEVYGPALAEYVAGRIELADDEHVDNARSVALLERFTKSVAGIPG